MFRALTFVLFIPAFQTKTDYSRPLLIPLMMSSNIYNEVAPEEDESHQAISSYFLGLRAENYEYFKKNILEILEGQRDASSKRWGWSSHSVMILSLQPLDVSIFLNKGH